MSIKTVHVDATQINGFKIETHSRQHIALVDQPIADGGSDSGPTPLEYLFIALAGCLITTSHIIAKQRHLSLRGIEMHIEGNLDIDGLLGKNRQVRAGFSGIRVHVNLDAEMNQSEKKRVPKRG